MNQAGRDALRQAALDGVRQIFGRLYDGDGGRCAAGVLADAAPVLHSWALYGLDQITHGCPACEAIGTISQIDEFALLVHMSDDHRFDFIKIAESMPVSAEP